jgi:hypothetical protein
VRPGWQGTNELQNHNNEENKISASAECCRVPAKRISHAASSVLDLACNFFRVVISETPASPMMRLPAPISLSLSTLLLGLFRRGLCIGRLRP